MSAALHVVAVHVVAVRVITEDLIPSFAVALGRLTGLYVLCLLATLAYWLSQAAWQARRGLWSHTELLLPLGLTSLLGAQLLGVPGLFGLGLGLALIALYFPLTRPRLPRRSDWPLSAAWMLSGLYCLSAAFIDSNLWALLLGVTLWVQALYTAVWNLGYALRPAARRPVARQDGPQPAARPLLPVWERGQASQVPDPPDLELSLEDGGARLHNISGKRLQLLGWSAAYVNEWWPLYDSRARGAGALPVGEYLYLRGWDTRLARPGRPSGLRVWYMRQGEDALYLFRADWVQPALDERGERVLN